MASRSAGVRRLVAATLALSAAPLFAHDLWIEPTTFSPAPGQVVGVRLRVGQDLVGEPLPRISALVNRFVVDDEADRQPIAGRDGADPAGVLRVARTGLLVLGYHSHPSRVELAPDKFNAYLIEEGLEAVTALRAARQETGALARERYIRCAKSLLVSGPPGRSSGDRPLGLPLELVAERNPYAMGAGEEFPVRLTYQGQPLAGALVVAMNSLNPTEKQQARSNGDGRVWIRLHEGGMWLVKAVHMVRAPVDADVEWTSFWASLTFATRSADSEASVPRRP